MKTTISIIHIGALLAFATGCKGQPANSDDRNHQTNHTITIRHVPRTNSHDWAQVWKVKDPLDKLNHKPALGDSFEWVHRADETNFSLVLPNNTNLVWEKVHGLPRTNAPCPFDSTNYLAFDGEFVDTNWTVQLKLTTNSVLTNLKGIHFQVIVPSFASGRGGGPTEKSAPFGYYDMVDATLIWDDPITRNP
jgi:hypothetical protein